MPKEIDILLNKFMRYDIYEERSGLIAMGKKFGNLFHHQMHLKHPFS